MQFATRTFFAPSDSDTFEEGFPCRLWCIRSFLGQEFVSQTVKEHHNRRAQDSTDAYDDYEAPIKLGGYLVIVVFVMYQSYLCQ